MKPTELLLLNPQDLLSDRQLSQQIKSEIITILDLLQESLIVDSDPQALKKINKKLQQIEPVEILPLSGDLFESTRLTPQQIQEFDRYMQVKHTRTCIPAKLIGTSLMTAYFGLMQTLNSCDTPIHDIHLIKVGFQEYISLLKRAFDLESITSEKTTNALYNRQDREEETLEAEKQPTDDRSSDITVLDRWRKGHWVFLVFTQALIIGLKRFIEAVNNSDLDLAKVELNGATQLLWASGAVMKITGNFKREQYENEVKFTMTPGHSQSLVQSEALSGLMMWDHDYLVNVIWKKELLPIFKKLPTSLQTEHESFVRAYQEGLSLGHKNICTKFGGSERESLTANHCSPALKNLEKFEVNRLKMLDPHHHVSSNNKCPFH
jgi:hypothetical protein